MTDDTTTTNAAERGQVSASAAEIYEAFFVPALFGQFAEPVLDHAGVERMTACSTWAAAPASSPGQHDVGSGRTARLSAWTRTRGCWRSRATPNRHRLAAGRRRGAPVRRRSFDHTLSQFAAMFFSDPATALTEMARVTAHGGTVTIATWCGLDRTPGYEAMVALIEDELGEAAADALRAPFVLGDPDLVRDLLAPSAPIRDRRGRGHRTLPVDRGLGSHRRAGLDPRRSGRRRS